MKFVRPVPFKEAIGKLGERLPVGADFSSSEWRDVPLAMRERAFFSSKVESVRFLDRAKSSLLDFLNGAREEITTPDGTLTTALKTGSRAQFVEQMREFAQAEGLPLTGQEGSISDIRSQRRLQLIFDTQVRQAHDYGNWKQGTSGAVLDEFPAQRFIRVVDVKEPRNDHTLVEGEVKLKSDVGFWRAINKDFGVPWGPWGWGCGHDVEDVDRAEAEQLGLVAFGQPVATPEVPFNESLKASVQNVDPDLLDKLRGSLGDQIMVKDGAVWWKGDRPNE